MQTFSSPLHHGRQVQKLTMTNWFRYNLNLFINQEQLIMWVIIGQFACFCFVLGFFKGFGKGCGNAIDEPPRY